VTERPRHDLAPYDPFAELEREVHREAGDGPFVAQHDLPRVDAMEGGAVVEREAQREIVRPVEVAAPSLVELGVDPHVEATVGEPRDELDPTSVGYRLVLADPEELRVHE